MIKKYMSAWFKHRYVKIYMQLYIKNLLKSSISYQFQFRTSKGENHLQWTRKLSKKKKRNVIKIKFFELKQTNEKRKLTVVPELD